MWTDVDTWINPGRNKHYIYYRIDWLDTPLDAFLHDVPEDRNFVLGNFRSAFSNVYFIRNSKKGRQLALDWLSIVVSGWVQCHGFDQVD